MTANTFKPIMKLNCERLPFYNQPFEMWELETDEDYDHRD